MTGGKELEYTAFGKPSAPTYRYAEKLIDDERKRLGVDTIGNCTALGRNVLKRVPLFVERIYGIGDNPQSGFARVCYTADLRRLQTFGEPIRPDLAGPQC